MTKTKKRKMSKSTFAIIIMAVVMVAMLAFGGTYAYFTASATTKTGEITTGHVKLSANGAEFTSIMDDVLPGDALFGADATLTIDTTDDVGNYVAIKFTITGGDGLSINANSIVAAEGEGWYASGTKDIYIWGTSATNCVAESATVTVPLTRLVIPTNVEDNWDEGTPANSEHSLMDATITVRMEARSIQASHLSATNAVTELVGLFA